MKHHHTHSTLRTTTELLFAAALALGSATAGASQLVYTPVNPSFGGNAFNGSYLMSIATQGASQNAPSPLEGLDLSSLSDSLNKISSTLGDICTGTGSTC